MTADHRPFKYHEGERARAVNWFGVRYPKLLRYIPLRSLVSPMEAGWIANQKVLLSLRARKKVMRYDGAEEPINWSGARYLARENVKSSIYVRPCVSGINVVGIASRMYLAICKHLTEIRSIVVARIKVAIKSIDWHGTQKLRWIGIKSGPVIPIEVVGVC